MSTHKAPPLPHGCNSWILVQREPRKAIGEYFSPRNANKMASILATEPDAARRYELLPAVDWLYEFNRRVQS